MLSILGSRMPPRHSLKPGIQSCLPSEHFSVKLAKRDLVPLARLRERAGGEGNVHGASSFHILGRQIAMNVRCVRLAVSVEDRTYKAASPRDRCGSKTDHQIASQAGACLSN